LFDPTNQGTVVIRFRSIASSLFSLLLVAILTGCASVPYMPLAENKEAVDTSKPLYLMSVSVKNEYRQRWQPRILNAFVVKDSGKANAQTFAYRMDDMGEIVPEDEDGVSTFLVRFTTDTSEHLLDGFMAHGRAFPVNGFYAMSMQLPIPQKESGVHYLGSVKAVIRERKDNEFRAGPVIPLIDQAVSGASTGTFDIVVSDAFEKDAELFKTTFPALKDVKIQKAILPQWDRAKIQSMWEKN